MAELGQLRRIAALVERLEPLASAGRKKTGDRIEAEDWNTVVEILLGVLGVDRGQEEALVSSLADRFAPADHQHPGEVTADWLSADLQARLAGGGESVATRRLVDELDGRISGLASQVAALSTQVEGLQASLDRAAAGELDRGRTLRNFEARFTNLESVRAVVGNLGNQVSGITGKVDELLALRGNLTDEQGNPLDLRGLRTEVGNLTTLTKNFNGVDGRPLKLAELELQLRDLSDVVGAGGSRGFEHVVTQVADQVRPALESRVQQAVDLARDEEREQRLAGEGRLRSEIATSVAASRDGLTQTLGQLTAASETRLSGRLDERLATASAQIARDASAAAATLVTDRLANLPAQVRGEVATAITPVRAELAASLQADLRTQVSGVEGRLNTRLERTERRVDGLEIQLPRRLGELVDARGLELEDRLGQSLEGRVAAATDGLRAEIAPRIAAAADERLGDLDERLAGAVAGRLGDLDERVGRAVAQATADQGQRVAEEVQVQLGQLDVPGRIAGATQTLGGQLRAELSRGLAEQQARTSTAIDGALTLVRGEIGAASRAASDDAVRRSKAEIAGLEGRLRPDSLRPVVIGPVIRPIG
ncbi:MAG TPA: hypothetical protein VF017_06755 [Thermoanaerobaculia bacterium]|nr:hypothetical protein [Thermoanaerobaculia bacterium]